MSSQLFFSVIVVVLLVFTTSTLQQEERKAGETRRRFTIRERSQSRLQPSQSVQRTSVINRIRKPGTLRRRRPQQTRQQIVPAESVKVFRVNAEPVTQKPEVSQYEPLSELSSILEKYAAQRRRGESAKIQAPQTAVPTVQRRKSFRRPSPVQNTLAQPSVQSNTLQQPNQKYKIVCYYTNWSQYRPKTGKYTPENIDPHLCTHIIFAFGWLKKGRLSSFESNDETIGENIGLFEKITSLKAQNPELQVLLAIGGWSFGTKKFKDMSKTRYTRQTFIYSAIPFLRDRNFDGLDIDWEYPKGGDDKKNYVLLLKELMEAFTAEAEENKLPRLLLTAAVPVGPDNIRSGYDVPAVSKYLDFINLMAYDFHGKWERQAGHNAPLVAPSSDSNWRQQLSVTRASEHWVKLGAPKHKLVIGMPTYGRSFTLSNAANNQVNAPASGGGKAGAYSREGGFLTYYEVCEMLLNGATYVWDEEMSVPYMISGDQWVGFDDERAIRNKMQWLMREGYGGAMVWSLDMDDFTGTFCPGKTKYPLIGAMREELHGVPRPGKDVDWSKVAKTRSSVVTTLPPPIPIDISEILRNLNLKPGNQLDAVLSDNSLTTIPEYNSQAPKVMCYYTQWSPKRPGLGQFQPEMIDPLLCTHVVYAFATIKDNKLAASEPDTDLSTPYEDGMYDRILKLKEKNPRLKVLLAVGGWAFGSKPFRELTDNVFRMNGFVYDAIQFLRKYTFDGVDIDWEYPRGRKDTERFVKLVKELRMAFEGEAEQSKEARLMLSAAVPASFEAVAAGYDVPEISKYLDLINLMSYDFHGQWERQVGHNSPLFALETASTYQKKLTVDFSAREWVRRGAPAEKLLIGIPTYGRTFTLSDETQFDINAPAVGGGKPGNFT